jgi:hypothetical protein
VDDSCSAPGTNFFYLGGPAQYWYQEGSYPYCYFWTTTTTSSSMINFANWYISPDSDPSGNYGFKTYIPSGHNTGKARYNRYRNGTSGGITSWVTMNQASFNNVYATVTSSAYLCSNANTPCSGYWQFADNGGSPGQAAVDISVYTHVH